MAARHFAIQRDLVSFHRRERQQQEVQEHQVQQERQPHHCPVSPDEQEQKHEQQESLQDHNILSKEEWIHSQQGVNDAVERLMRQKSSSSSSSSLSSTTSSTRRRHDRRGCRRQMTIIQTDMTMSPLQQQHPLRCLGLFRALRYTGMIQSLSLVGIAPQLEQDEQSCQALAQAVHTSPTLSRLHITHLSIFSSPTLSSLLSSLCHVLTTTTTNVESSPQDMSSSTSSSSSRRLALRDLRLAFRDDFRTSHEQQQQYSNTQQLLHALTKCAGLLQCLHLYGLNLSQFETTDLVTLVQEHNQSLQELKLVRCNLVSINQLCHAMMTTTTTTRSTTKTTTTTMVNHNNNDNDKVNESSGYTSWTKIDFSMNHIRCLNDLAPLLRMTSKNDHDDNKNNDNNNHYYCRGGLTELSLSQNNLCGDCPRSNNNDMDDDDDDDIDDNNVDGKLFCHALATNTTLLRLSLDLNPLSQSFGTNLYHVLTHDNTTLLRLSVVVWGTDNQYQYHHSRSSNGVLSFSSHGHGRHGRRHGHHCIRLLSQTCVAQLRMAVAMNEAGRKWLHQQPNALPQLMARVQHEPTLLYGLLQEQLYFV